MKPLTGITAPALFLGALAVSAMALPRPANHTVRAELPPLTEVSVKVHPEPLALIPEGMIDLKRIPECSSLEKSLKRTNTFWAISDSGNKPVAFAVRDTGDVVMPLSQRDRYKGISITGTRNLDWECLALDEEGNLIIGDVGNNLSNRRNLCFYMVPEPSPQTDIVTPQRKKVSFYYPSQDEFPSPTKNYDCEACFALNGQIYFFTKHWSDTETVLWRVDPTVESYQAAIPVSRFDARGMVTDASLSPSRKRLAVLTYHGLWVFELPERGKNGKVDETKFFTANPAVFRRLVAPSEQWQVESVAFIDEDTLLIAAEQGALFRVNVKDLAPKEQEAASEEAV